MALLSLLSLLTVLGFIHFSAGDPLLDCPKTVEARIGDNVTLRCHLDSEENIEHETIHCRRTDSSQPVYAYRNGKKLPDQEDQYRHRTSLDFEDLKIGVLNLNINSVTQSDEGTFIIYISKWGISSTVTLIVGNPLLVCQETVEARISDNVTLTCQLEPKQNIEHETIDCKISDSSQLVYARRNGKQLPDQEDQYRHRTSLDFEDLKIGVLNLTINSVTKSDNGTYRFYISKWGIRSTVTLIVEPADLKKTERQNSSSAETSVTGDPPPSDDPPSDDPPSRDRHGDLIAAVLALIVALIVALVVVVWILVKRKKIRRCWRQRDDEDPQRAAGNGHLDPEHPAESESML